MVKHCGSGRGLAAIRKLHQAFASVTAQGRRKLVQQLLHPPVAKTYEDMVVVREAWEKSLRRYEASTGTSLPDDVLIAGHLTMLPKRLQEDFHSLDHDFTRLHDVKRYVLKQVNAHRDCGR